MVAFHDVLLPREVVGHQESIVSLWIKVFEDGEHTFELLLEFSLILLVRSTIADAAADKLQPPKLPPPIVWSRTNL